MDKQLAADIEKFLDTPRSGAGPIFNEHGLQLELGIHLRLLGYEVQFERPFAVSQRASATKRPKKELDMLVIHKEMKTAIELKTPLAGRVPETMYDFCADIQFVEQLIEMKFADAGFCLLVTNERQFWHSDLRHEGIYGFFRNSNLPLTGIIEKPTGARDSALVVTGSYSLGPSWKPLGNSNLMLDSRYLLVSISKIGSGSHPSL